MAPKHTPNALTHLSHDAMAHQGHDEPSNTTPTRATQRLQFEKLFQQASYWDTELPKALEMLALWVSTNTWGLKNKKHDHDNGTPRCL